MGFHIGAEPQGNFIMVGMGKNKIKASELVEKLMRNRITIREADAYTTQKWKDTYIRISIGTMEQNKILIEEIKKILS